MFAECAPCLQRHYIDNQGPRLLGPEPWIICHCHCKQESLFRLMDGDSFGQQSFKHKASIVVYRINLIIIDLHRQSWLGWKCLMTNSQFQFWSSPQLLSRTIMSEATMMLTLLADQLITTFINLIRAIGEFICHGPGINSQQKPGHPHNYSR